MPITISRSLASLLFVLLATGCASNVVHHPEPMTAVDAVGKSPAKTLANDIAITLDTGYTRLLKSGSQWTPVGNVKQGQVFKPHNDIFTLEGAHVHEAYLVVANSNLVGFYLPVERGFSPLKQKLSLIFSE